MEAKPGAGSGLYIVPEGGAKQSENGGVELLLGALVDYCPSSGDKRDLKAETTALLEALRKGDKDLKVEGTESATVGGKQGFTRLKTRTSYTQDPEQVVQLYTVVRPVGLWTFAMASPTSFFGKVEPIF